MCGICREVGLKEGRPERKMCWTETAQCFGVGDLLGMTPASSRGFRVENKFHSLVCWEPIAMAVGLGLVGWNGA